jgi:hypothetical protein
MSFTTCDQQEPREESKIGGGGEVWMALKRFPREV